MSLVPLLLLLAASSLAIEEVMAGAHRREAELDREVRDAQFLAEYRYEEREADGRVRSVETCLRRVYVRGGRQVVEFLEVTADGRVLAGRERERKLRELRARGLAQDRTRMPFRRETAGEYRYELAGDTLLDGRRAWRVEFRPARSTGRHIVGRGWLSADSTCDILRLEFRPDRLPFVVPEMEMTLAYEQAGNRTLPARFDLEMRVLVRLIVTLAERHISIEDRFGGYRFNTGLPDSLFE
ncbi:MAG: hypothetical protein R6X12_00625 [bacterium]